MVNFCYAFCYNEKDNCPGSAGLKARRRGGLSNLRDDIKWNKIKTGRIDHGRQAPGPQEEEGTL